MGRYFRRRSAGWVSVRDFRLSLVECGLRQWIVHCHGDSQNESRGPDDASGPRWFHL